jgi:hypothetical protein
MLDVQQGIFNESVFVVHLTYSTWKCRHYQQLLLRI